MKNKSLIEEDFEIRMELEGAKKQDEIPAINSNLLENKSIYYIEEDMRKDSQDYEAEDSKKMSFETEDFEEKTEKDLNKEDYNKAISDDIDLEDRDIDEISFETENFTPEELEWIEKQLGYENTKIEDMQNDISEPKKNKQTEPNEDIKDENEKEDKGKVQLMHLIRKYYVWISSSLFLILLLLMFALLIKYNKKTKEESVGAANDYEMAISDLKRENEDLQGKLEELKNDIAVLMSSSSAKEVENNNNTNENEVAEIATEEPNITNSETDDTQTANGQEEAQPPVEESIAPPPATENPPVSKNYPIHVVQEGESLMGLAKRYFGAASYYTEIMKENNLTNKEDIRIGQKLRIPKNQ